MVGIDNAPAAVAEAERLARDRGLANLTLVRGDVYALGLPDGQFDVVHAHQVLHHLSDPVAALREMRRVCTPEGIVAVRDADYSAMTWFPDHPGMDRWLELYILLTRRNGGEPDAGRRLRRWAIDAGFGSVSSTLRPGASPKQTIWRGGRPHGPSVWSPHLLVARPCSWVWRRTPSWRRWRGAGASGPPRRMPGSLFCTAK